ncbi:SH3 domain-containing protein [Salinarimonas ramus]|uniref:SH3b domain-containing protein n=1 Tax=Salinarimonas ramus TaxID=690164 RepID=A0A917V3I6_9HYPH|nr:SH3 domain-containing protein [Salinarimonas ramus]GGK31349.1 hypothetical protein GCM10011322_17400 [Salinarimonas ramus]
MPAKSFPSKTFLGRLGLASAACLMSAAAWAYPAQVATDLNMRAGPGTGYGVVSVLPGGAVVDVEGCRGSWCRVHYRGREGWASARYLADAPRRGVQGRYYDDRPPVLSAPGYDYQVERPGFSFEFGIGPRYDDRYERRRRVHPDRGPVTRRDRDGDGYVDTIRQVRPDGSVVVRRDRDGDGEFDTVRIRRPDGSVVVRRD